MTHPDMPGPDPRVALGLELLGFEDLEPGEDDVIFTCGQLDGRAYLRSGGDRIRGHVVLARLGEDPEPALDWLERQPLPASGVLEVYRWAEDDHRLRMLFERGTDAVSTEDPLAAEVAEYAAAWTRRSTVPERSPDLWDCLYVSDPTDQAPENAWLMLGSEASFPSDDDLIEDAIRGLEGVYENLWTASKQTLPGDLLLFYFVAPRRSINFVARAASRAFYDPDIGVNASGDVRDEQWWCYTTPLVRVTPIDVDQLRDAAGGHLILRGRSGRYLRPEVVDALELEAADADFAPEVGRIGVTPVGHADLPDPRTVDLDGWRAMAGGALRLEADVERHVVEPLVRLALALAGAARDLDAQVRVGRRVADYVVSEQGQSRCVIEVKLGIRESRDGGWPSSPDVRQMRAYAEDLGCAGMLIDAQRVLLFDRGRDDPTYVLERRHLSPDDLKDIGLHLAGSATAT